MFKPSLLFAVKASLLLCFLLLFKFGYTQDTKDNVKEDALNVFIDCYDYNCNQQYFRQEMNMVNYVRDVKDADVYILMPTQSAGSGGRVMTLIFDGQNKFEGQNDTLVLNMKPDITEQEALKAMVKSLKAGLLSYIAKTPIFEKMDLSGLSVEEEQQAAPQATKDQKDKWNSWVYSIGFNAYLNGEDSYSSINTWSNISARRVTEEWKVAMNLFGSFDKNTYRFDGEEFIAETQSYGASGSVIKSINDHWSTGLGGGLSSSTYSNTERSYRLYPALEYNLFPYKESTTRQLRFSYRMNYQFNNYRDSTIFDKIDEHLFQQSIGVAYENVAKWGSINASLIGRHYMHDPNLNNIRLSTNLNVRVVKGLSVRFSANVALIRDQVSLQKAGASLEETLLQLRELQKSYRYWGSFGLNYTFGSIFNNVVNPRFGYGL